MVRFGVVWGQLTYETVDDTLWLCGWPGLALSMLYFGGIKWFTWVWLENNVGALECPKTTKSTVFGT
jgi:hypothetical protein